MGEAHNAGIKALTERVQSDSSGRKIQTFETASWETAPDFSMFSPRLRERPSPFGACREREQADCWSWGQGDVLSLRLCSPLTAAR